MRYIRWVLFLVVLLALVLPMSAILAENGTGPPGIPSLPDFLASLQTPAGLAVAVWLVLEIIKGRVTKEFFDAWGLGFAIGLSVVLPLAALLLSAALGLGIVTADTIYYAMAAAFLVSQGYFGISNGIAKARQARDTVISG